MGICSFLAWGSSLPTYPQLSQHIVLETGGTSSNHHQLLPEREDFIWSRGQSPCQTTLLLKLSSTMGNDGGKPLTLPA